MDIIELNTCGHKYAFFAVTLPRAVEPADVQTLSDGRILVQNPIFSPPHFKIVDKFFTLRGAIGQPRLTAQFNSTDKEMCQQMLSKIATTIT